MHVTEKWKDVCLETFVISVGMYQDMRGRCLWFNCIWYILSSSSSSFRDFFFSSSSLSIHCRVNVFLQIHLLSIFVKISCYACSDYSYCLLTVTLVRVEVFESRWWSMRTILSSKVPLRNARSSTSDSCLSALKNMRNKVIQKACHDQN